MALFIIAFSIIASVGDSPAGSIGGRVLNKTLNEKAMDGLEVTLYRYNEKETLELGRTKTDQNGHYYFDGINGDEGNIYYAATFYKEIEYFTSAINLEQEKAESSHLNVYETTDRDEDIRIKMHHIFLESGGPPFEIREAMVLENRGNRTYVGSKEVQPGKRETLRISLPDKATGLQYMHPAIVNTEGGFSDTKEIKPGTKNIIFSYRINPAKSNYTFKKDLDLETDNLRFIFSDAGISARSDQLAPGRPLTNKEHRFLYLSGKDFSKGSQVLVTLSLPGQPVGENIFKGVIIGLAILLVGAGFAFSYRKRRNSGENEGSPESEGLDLSMERKTLLQAIADLDEQYESDGIDVQTYHRKRSEYLKKAKEISQKIQSDVTNFNVS